jgi:hypothetical protein
MHGPDQVHSIMLLSFFLITNNHHQSYVCTMRHHGDRQTCLAAAHLFLVLFGLTNLYRL